MHSTCSGTPTCYVSSVQELHQKSAQQILGVLMSAGTAPVYCEQVYIDYINSGYLWLEICRQVTVTSG